MELLQLHFKFVKIFHVRPFLERNWVLQFVRQTAEYNNEEEDSKKKKNVDSNTVKRAKESDIDLHLFQTINEKSSTSIVSTAVEKKLSIILPSTLGKVDVESLNGDTC